MIIETAGAADADALVALINAAYRGASAARGWTHEAGLLEGQRTDIAMVRELLAKPGATILVGREAAGAGPAACVAVEPAGEPATWSIGMLTVDPDRQAGGLGRQLLRAAEAHAASSGAEAVEMTVIAFRAGLIAWYERCGYRRTGGTRPFPYGDERFGRPLRDDLSFVVLEKRMPLARTSGAATGPR